MRNVCYTNARTSDVVGVSILSFPVGRLTKQIAGTFFSHACPPIVLFASLVRFAGTSISMIETTMGRQFAKARVINVPMRRAAGRFLPSFNRIDALLTAQPQQARALSQNDNCQAGQGDPQIPVVWVADGSDDLKVVAECGQVDFKSLAYFRLPWTVQPSQP